MVFVVVVLGLAVSVDDMVLVFFTVVVVVVEEDVVVPEAGLGRGAAAVVVALVLDVKVLKDIINAGKLMSLLKTSPPPLLP